MGLLKLLMLALATTTMASTFYSTAAPAVVPSNKLTTIYTTEIAKVLVPEPTQPVIVETSFSGVSDSGIMTAVSSSPLAIPVNSTVVVSLPLSTTVIVPVNTTISTTDIADSTSYDSSPTTNLSTVVITTTASHSSHSGHSASSSASGSAKPSTVPGNGGGKVKVGIAVGLAVLMVGTIGA